MKARLAILDDEARMAEVLAMVLGRDYRVATFTSASACLQALADGGFDLLVTDLKMPEMSGLEVLARARAIDADLPVVVITAHGTIETAIEAMKQGAFDYVTKPFDNDACRALVARALDLTRLARENRYLRAELATRYGPGSLIAISPAMRQVIDLARRAAGSSATALISGETGSGKEVIARAIHYYSDRVGGPFVAVNCRALAPGVLESELFGHERGAFTGADSARVGLFERASGGTLLLDEIGEVPGDFQAALLRVLQEREVVRVGGSEPRPVDVRVVAATNRELTAEVAAGRFREDLYFRLAVIPISLPPLRDRPADILPLARFFLARMNSEHGRALPGWSDEVEGWLLTHRWPGNVRELENTLERGVVLARGDQIELSDLVFGDDRAPAAGGTLQEHLDAEAAAHIRRALQRAGGVRVEAARLLGVERTTLYRLMKRYGLS